jgi:transposase-like protein
MTGNKEVLGLRIAENEGAKFWLQVVTELKNRCVQDILIACATVEQASQALDVFETVWG